MKLKTSLLFMVILILSSSGTLARSENEWLNKLDSLLVQYESLPTEQNAAEIVRLIPDDFVREHNGNLHKIVSRLYPSVFRIIFSESIVGKMYSIRFAFKSLYLLDGFAITETQILLSELLRINPEIFLEVYQEFYDSKLFIEFTRPETFMHGIFIERPHAQELERIKRIKAMMTVKRKDLFQLRDSCIQSLEKYKDEIDYQNDYYKNREDARGLIGDYSKAYEKLKSIVDTAIVYFSVPSNQNLIKLEKSIPRQRMKLSLMEDDYLGYFFSRNDGFPILFYEALCGDRNALRVLFLLANQFRGLRGNEIIESIGSIIRIRPELFLEVYSSFRKEVQTWNHDPAIYFEEFITSNPRLQKYEVNERLNALKTVKNPLLQKEKEELIFKLNTANNEL